MHRPQEQVRQLHREVCNAPTSPAEPKLRNPELRAKLILEEAIETAIALVGSEKATELLVGEAGAQKLLRVSHSWWEPNDDPADMKQPNLVEAIDGCVDVLVVTYGTLEDIGVDGEPFFDEVQKSNLAKKNGPMREDGKRLKPPGWMPPDIAGVLKRLTCDHGVMFDEEAARGLSADEIHRRWPRLYGPCPKGCGFSGISYASAAHYIMGDW